jgi:hypothetical protein
MEVTVVEGTEKTQQRLTVFKGLNKILFRSTGITPDMRGLCTLELIVLLSDQPCIFWSNNNKARRIQSGSRHVRGRRGRPCPQNSVACRIFKFKGRSRLYSRDKKLQELMPV